MEHTKEAEVLDSLTVNDTTHVEQPRKLSTNEKEFPSTNYEADHILNLKSECKRLQKKKWKKEHCIFITITRNFKKKRQEQMQSVGSEFDRFENSGGIKFTRKALSLEKLRKELCRDCQHSQQS